MIEARGATRRRHRWRRQLAAGRIFLYQVLLIVALLLIWEIAVRQGWLKVYLYGQPSGIYRETQRLAFDGKLWTDTWVTAQEAILGFAVGSLLGSLAGLTLWLWPTAAAVLRPIMVAANGVPKIALAPLIVAWFGVGMESKIAIAAIITFIVALITSYTGTQETDDDLIRLMRSLGATRWQTFTKIVVPGTVPWIVSAFRLNVGFALIGAVVGEYISAENGLGHLVYYSGVLYNLNAVWLGIFVLMILALVMDYAVAQIERRYRWRVGA